MSELNLPEEIRMIENWVNRGDEYIPSKYVKQLLKALSDARDEIEITDELYEKCRDTLFLIPECPTHGRHCIPHYKNWIRHNLENNSTPYVPGSAKEKGEVGENLLAELQRLKGE